MVRSFTNRLQLSRLQPNDVPSDWFTFRSDEVLLVWVVNSCVKLSKSATLHSGGFFFFQIKTIVNILVRIFLASWNLNFLLLAQVAISVWNYLIIDSERLSSVNVVLLSIFGCCDSLIDFLWRLFEVRLIWEALLLKFATCWVQNQVVLAWKSVSKRGRWSTGLLLDSLSKAMQRGNLLLTPASYFCFIIATDRFCDLTAKLRRLLHLLFIVWLLFMLYQDCGRITTVRGQLNWQP